MVKKKITSAFLLLFVALVIFFVGAYAIDEIWQTVCEAKAEENVFFEENCDIFKESPLLLRGISLVFPVLYSVLISYFGRRKKAKTAMEYGYIQDVPGPGKRFIASVTGEEFRIEMILFAVVTVPISFILFTGENELLLWEKLVYPVILSVSAVLIFALADLGIWVLALRPLRRKNKS